VPDARLELVGDGPDHTGLAAREMSGVTLHGRRDDVPDWYAAADVVVVPSRWEGMSLAVLEALASGACVVAADVTGVRESMPAGARGLVPSEDVGALTEAVVDRLRDAGLRAEEGARGAEHVARRHSLESTCEGIAAVYETLLRS
jgi:glycosyltransferase involved in cell wall biosynthesis